MRYKLENGLNLELNYNNFTAKVICSQDIEGDVIIPRSIFYHSHEYLITCISEGSFNDTEYLESLLFANNSECRSIESDSFNNTNLMRISLPSSINELKKGWCRSIQFLTDITISSENHKFKYIYKSMIVSKSEKNSQNYDIIHFVRRDIKRAIIPSYVKYIDAYAFAECYNLKEVIFNENSELISISDYAFTNTPFETISIPRKVKEIGDYCFAFCTNLKEIIFEKDSELESIGCQAFADTMIDTFSIPTKTQKIGEFAFIYCHYLENIHFSAFSEMKVIGKKSFANLGIKSILIPKSVTSISEGSFVNCTKLKEIEFEKDSELISIEKNAFYNCPIESLFIPSKVDELKEGWCFNVKQLNNIILSPANKRFSLINNSIIIGKSNEKSESYDVLHFIVRNTSCVIIPSFIKYINSYSFCDCYELSEIIFPKDSKLISIGKFAFFDSKIKSIFIPKNVKLIDESSFSCCKELYEVIFLEGFEKLTIEKNVFNFSSIEKIHLSSNVDELIENWCSNVTNLKFISISPDNKRFIYLDDLMILGKKDIKDETYEIVHFVRRDVSSVVIPSFITHIDSCSFSFTEYLVYAGFEEDSKLVSIGNDAFANSSIERFDVPKHVQKIGQKSFQNCKMLKNISFSKDSELISIESFAFSQSSIDMVSIPSHVREIGKNAFEKCFNLHYLEFKENSELVSIGEQAFYGSLIENIIIPKKVCQIGKNAFAYCHNFRSIEFLADCLCLNDTLFDECSNLILVSFPNASKVSLKTNEFHNVSSNLSIFCTFDLKFGFG